MDMWTTIPRSVCRETRGVCRSSAGVAEPFTQANGKESSMLTLTPTATDAVRQIVAQGPVDDDTGGLRIAAGQPTPEGVPLELSLVNGPEAEDQEIGAADAHVYLEPRVA